MPYHVHFLLSKVMWRLIVNCICYSTGQCGEALAVVMNSVYDWTIQLVGADELDPISFCRWGQWSCLVIIMLGKITIIINQNFCGAVSPAEQPPGAFE